MYVFFVKAVHSIAAGKRENFPPGYFVFKNENVKVKVKYGFVFGILVNLLHIGNQNKGIRMKIL